MFSKTDDFIKNHKFVNKAWKGVKSEKIKVFPLLCSKYLSSWTGLGKSGYVRFPTFGQILYVLNLKTFDFIKSDKFANKKWKGVISGKYFRWFAVSTCPPGQVLASPDMSDFRFLVEFCMFWVQN